MFKGTVKYLFASTETLRSNVSFLCDCLNLPLKEDKDNSIYETG